MPSWKKVIVTGSDAVLASINVDNSVVATSFTGSFSGSLDADDQYVPRSLVNGTFKESFDCFAISDGVTITAELSKDGGGDLTMQFSDGNFILDCTPSASIALTEGSIAAPQENFIYVPQSTKVLTKSTTGWPSTEHIKVSYFFVQTAAYVQADGALINQNWNDHLVGSNGMGHLAHMAERSRRLGAIYASGITGNGTDDYITITGGSPDTIAFKSVAGVIYQMHTHNFPVKDTSGTDDFHIVNHPTTTYSQSHDLATPTLIDNTGASLSGLYYTVVVAGVANKGGQYAPLLLNLPGGGYSSEDDAINDVDNYNVFTLPREFNIESSTGFLIAAITMKHSPAGGGTWTHVNTTSLLGQTPSTAGGGGGAGGAITEFSDNQFKIYNVTDSTKIFTFDASNITTGNTRIYNMPDFDATMSTLAGSETLTNKTLTTPTIGSFTNATHDHSNTAGGGTISYTNLTNVPENIVSASAQIATEISGAFYTDSSSFEGRITANETHVSSDGSDHIYIDQDVTSGASPTFDGANFIGILSASHAEYAETASLLLGSVESANTSSHAEYAKTASYSDDFTIIGANSFRYQDGNEGEDYVMMGGDTGIAAWTEQSNLSVGYSLSAASASHAEYAKTASYSDFFIFAPGAGESKIITADNDSGEFQWTNPDDIVVGSANTSSHAEYAKTASYSDDFTIIGANSFRYQDGNETDDYILYTDADGYGYWGDPDNLAIASASYATTASYAENAVGGGGVSVYGTFYATSGNQNITTTTTTVTIDGTLTNVGSGLSLSSNEITFTNAGDYNITYNLGAVLGGGTREGLYVWVEVDDGGGYQTVTGSTAYLYGRLTTEVHGTAGATIIRTFSASDKIRLRAYASANSFNTMANAVAVTIMKMG